MTARIVALRLYPLDIPFRMGFAHHLKDRRSSESLLLSVELEDGTVGWGEALPRDYVTGETVASVIESARGMASLLGTPLVGAPVSAQPALGPVLSGLAGTPAARGLIELALLDAAARLAGQSVATLLGGPCARSLTYSAVISGSAPESVAKWATMAAAIGMSQVKLKVGRDPALDRANVAAVLKAHPTARLRVDANNAWTPDEAGARADALVEAGVVGIEQPFEADLEAWSALRRHLGGRSVLIADEAVTSIDEARRLLAADAVDVLNIKVGKVGGLENAIAIAELARAHGARSLLGAHVGETSVMTAAGATLGALIGDLVAHEGAVGELLLESDVVGASVCFGAGGEMDVTPWIECPGWGLEVRPPPGVVPIRIGG